MRKNKRSKRDDLNRPHHTRHAQRSIKAGIRSNQMRRLAHQLGIPYVVLPVNPGRKDE